MKNTLVFFMAIFSLIMMVVAVSGLTAQELPKAPTYQFEPIYTLEDMYYIEGNTVYTESGETHSFNSIQDAFRFVSMRTVTDNREGYECLDSNYPLEDDDCDRKEDWLYM